MYVRRKNCEYGRIKRSSRKTKACDTFSNNFGSYFKLFLLWATVMTLDFLMEFRFEYIWPCWLLICTINDFFKYQGVAFAIFFTLIALTSDLICFMLVPSSWLFLFGSTCVWVELVWYADRASGPSDVGHMMSSYVTTTLKNPVTMPINFMSKLERGMCVPTVALCFFFLYMEVAVRLRDPKNIPLSIDICRPFAAHCIGYPVVTLGFGLKSLLSHQFRLRKQRQVQAQNLRYFCLLESALPEEARALNRVGELANGQALSNNSNTPIYPSNTITGNTNLSAITSSTTTLTTTISSAGEKTTTTSTTTRSRKHNQQQSQHHQSSQQQNLTNGKLSTELTSGRSGNSHSVTDDSMERRSFSTVEGNFFGSEGVDSTSQLKDDGSPSVCSTASNSTNNSEAALTSSGGSSLSGQEEIVAVIDQSPRVSTSSKTLNTSNASSGTGGVGGSAKKNPASTAAAANKGKSGTDSSKTSGGAGRSKDAHVQKMEDELRKLRNERQHMMVTENDLRSQVAQLSAVERASRTESSQARQEVEHLQTKLSSLNQRLFTERENLQASEKRLADERRQRTVLEQQLANEKRARKEAEEKVLPIASASQTISKAVNKPVGANRTAVGTSPSTNQRTSTCSSEICSHRLRELEAQVKLVTRELAQKEAQLASLQASPPHSSANYPFLSTDRQQKMQAVHQQKEDQRRVNDLASQVKELQAENLRLQLTLKAEDKMKQELLTGYHTSLKEITELNSTLTQKEYQIGEMNMRLDQLNPNNPYSYFNMNLLDSSNKSPEASTLIGQRGARDLVSPSSSSGRYASSGRLPLPYLNGCESTTNGGGIFSSRSNISECLFDGLFSDSMWPFSNSSVSSPSVAVTAPSSSSFPYLQQQQQHRHMHQQQQQHQNNPLFFSSSSSSFDACDYPRMSSGSNNGFSTLLSTATTGEDDDPLVMDNFSASFGKTPGMNFNIPLQTTVVAASTSSCISFATSSTANSTVGVGLCRTSAPSPFLSTHTTDVNSMSTPAFLNQLRSQLNVNTSTSATVAMGGSTGSPGASSPVDVGSKAVGGPLGNPVVFGTPIFKASEADTLSSSSTIVDAGGDSIEGELIT